MRRVVANLSWLIPGGVGGSEEYTVRLLQAVLAAAPADIDLRIVGSPALRDAHPELGEIPFDTVPGPMAARAYRSVVESTRVARLTRSADVVHHFGGRIPARHHGNDVVTIHDLQPLHLPENFSTVKRRYLGAVLPRTAASARIICTPSDWVASTVVDAFAVDGDRVRGISSTYSTDPARDPGLADSLGAGPVVLYPAVTHPHKNHEVLVRAVETLVARHPGLVLVLTGAVGRNEAAVAATVERSSVRCIRPGRVSVPVLGSLLGRADVLAFPSRYEGFGLPVLEAMYTGTPVVAADATALPEVAGDAALLVPPDDEEGWADALDRVLTDTTCRTELVEKGRKRAAHYAPPVAGARLIDAWRAVD